MFDSARTLIVVYKDELLVNQLKKLIETKDDSNDDSVVGTRDNSINIVSWTEKVWISQKKAGNIKDKVLFLGDIKDTDKLIPVIDTIFDDSGVRFGWAGKQAVLYADPKELSSREAYLSFLRKLDALPVPESIKHGVRIRVETEEMCEPLDESSDIDMLSKDSGCEPEQKAGLLQKAKATIEAGVEVVGQKLKKVGDGAVVIAEDLFRDKAMVKKQMLFYGVVNLYLHGLERFMDM